MGCGCEVCVVNETQPSIKGITCDHTLSTHHNKMSRTNVSVGDKVEINPGITFTGHMPNGTSFPLPANLSIHGTPENVKKFVNNTPGFANKNSKKNRTTRVDNDKRAAEDGTPRVTGNAKIWNVVEKILEMERAIIGSDREKFSDAASILDTYESQRKAVDDEKEARKAKTLKEGAAVAACLEKFKESQEALSSARKQLSEVKAANARINRELKAREDLKTKHENETLPPPTPDQLDAAAKSVDSEVTRCGHKIGIGIMRSLANKNESATPHHELGEPVNDRDDTSDESATDDEE